MVARLTLALLILLSVLMPACVIGACHFFLVTWPGVVNDGYLTAFGLVVLAALSVAMSCAAFQLAGELYRLRDRIPAILLRGESLFRDGP